MLKLALVVGIIIGPSWVFASMVKRDKALPTPCDNASPCMLTVSSVEQGEVTCYQEYGAKESRKPVKTGECFVVATDHKKQVFKIFVGSSGCKYKAGQQLKMETQYAGCEPKKLFSLIKCTEGDDPKLMSLYSHKPADRACYLGFPEMLIDKQIRK